MGEFTTLRNIIFLIFAVFIAFIGIKFSLYGLIVNAIGSDLQEISINDVKPENLKTKRYIKIKDGIVMNFPLEYINDHGEVVSYIYPMSNNMDPTSGVTSNIVLESKTKIKNREDTPIQGLLKPYWYKVDKTILAEFEYRGISVAEDAYYLQIGEKPVKWYWYLLILFVALLFFYRMAEAAVKGFKFNHSKVSGSTSLSVSLNKQFTFSEL